VLIVLIGFSVYIPCALCSDVAAGFIIGLLYINISAVLKWLEGYVTSL
jgi:hypothetical protein